MMRKEYKKKLTVWELEKNRAFREKRQANWELEPTEPRRQLLLIPVETSKSQLYSDLESSGNIGMIMCSTEIDALTEALRSDHGKHTSIIRMCFHHEPISKNYKIDGRMVVVKHPRLAMCISGTLQQLFEFIRSIEDGTYSRISFYTSPGIFHWIGEKEGDENMVDDELFDGLADELRAVFNFLNRGEEILICTTPEQRMRHEETFNRLFEETKVDAEDGFQAILGRHGLNVHRIASILSALRIYESGFYFNDYTCTEEDFDTALTVMEILVKHSLQLSTILDRSNHRNELTRFSKSSIILKKLPEAFTYSEFVEKALRNGMSRSTAKRTLRNLIKKGKIIKIKDMYHKVKTKKPLV